MMVMVRYSGIRLKGTHDVAARVTWRENIREKVWINMVVRPVTCALTLNAQVLGEVIRIFVRIGCPCLFKKRNTWQWKDFIWHVGYSNQCPFDPNCCQPNMEICLRIHHNWVALTIFGSFPHPGSHVHQWISQPPQWIWECPSFCAPKNRWEFLLSQKYAASLLDLVLLGFSIANGSENQKPMACVEVAVTYPVDKSLVKQQVDKMCNGRRCISLVGLILMDFKVAWWAFLQIQFSWHAELLYCARRRR